MGLLFCNDIENLLETLKSIHFFDDFQRRFEAKKGAGKLRPTGYQSVIDKAD